MKLTKKALSMKTKLECPIFNPLKIIYALLFITILFAATIINGDKSQAASSTIGSAGTYTMDEITAAAQEAGGSGSYLSNNAADFAKVFYNVESGGNAAVYNGSCCTGLAQMNQTNLATFCNCTKEQYASMSAVEQLAVYNKYIESDVLSSSGAQQLLRMQELGQSLGGVQVTGAMIASCAQLGPGNCAKSIANNCSSTAVGEGGDGYVNICSMAAKAMGETYTGSSTTTTSTTDSTSSSSSSTTTSSSLCIGCIMLDVVGAVVENIPAAAGVIVYKYGPFILGIIVFIKLFMIVFKANTDPNYKFFSNFFKFGLKVTIISALISFPLLITSYAIPIVGAAITIYAEMSNSLASSAGTTLSLGGKSINLTACTTSATATTFNFQDQSSYPAVNAMEGDTSAGMVASDSTVNSSDINNNLITPLKCLVQTLSVPSQFVMTKVDAIQKMSVAGGVLGMFSVSGMVMSMQAALISLGSFIYEVVVSAIIVISSLSLIIGLFIMPFVPLGWLFKSTQNVTFFAAKSFLYIASTSAVVSMINIVYMIAIVKVISSMNFLISEIVPYSSSSTVNITWTETFTLFFGPILGAILQCYAAFKAVELNNSIISRGEAAMDSVAPMMQVASGAGAVASAVATGGAGSVRAFNVAREYLKKAGKNE